MKKVKTIAVSLISLGLVFGLQATAFAREGESGVHKEHTSPAQEVRTETTNTVESTTNEPKRVATDQAEKARASAEEKRAQIRQKQESLRNQLRAVKQQHATKLEGNRLAQCENREKNINNLLKKGAETAQLRLTIIQKHEKAITDFYTNKKLSADEYDAALAKADEKEAIAIAVINELAKNTYACGEVDGAKPADSIKTMITQKRNALHDYRTSVKELLLVVKQSLAEADTASKEGQS